MRRRRLHRRHRPEPPRLFKTWMTLAFLVLLLVMLIMMKSRLADSAAGCFSHMTSEPAEKTLDFQPDRDHEESQTSPQEVKVIPPPEK